MPYKPLFISDTANKDTIAEVFINVREFVKSIRQTETSVIHKTNH